MKSAILTTLMLVAVGSQPVFAAKCQFGACDADTVASSEILVSAAQTDKDAVLKKLNDATSRSDGHCCKVSDEAAFCLIQRPYISKTLLTRRISPRGSP
ncbi:hypothetical protein DBZ78_23200 [Salmonella enterica subsp. enterica serovar Brancaster]|nr:hypothetical protein DBZ78_23200 [Salmonella enterica subsp. enterica serovar Brancaster]